MNQSGCRDDMRVSGSSGDVEFVTVLVRGWRGERIRPGASLRQNDKARVNSDCPVRDVFDGLKRNVGRTAGTSGGAFDTV